MSDCLNPTTCYVCGHCVARDGVVSPNLVFSYREALEYYLRITPCESAAISMMEANGMTVPCGKCAACQLRKRKDWSVRLAHEASQHEQCCFITLTYDDEHCPVTDWRPVNDSAKVIDRGVGELPERTLLPADVQKFLKRLRRHLEYIPRSGLKDGKAYARNLGVAFDHLDTPIRYFAVGEYGSKTRRPHYHIIIFGWSPSDKVVHKMHNGKPVYRSAQLEALWQYGYSSVTDVSPFVAKYCARYVTKKFARLNCEPDLTDLSVIPEFTLQSVRNGGIGATWFDRFGVDACRRGLCTVRCGDRISRCSIPRYYMARLRKYHLPVWIECRDHRIDWINEHSGLKSAVDVVRDYDDLCRKVDTAAYYDNLASQQETF